MPFTASPGRGGIDCSRATLRYDIYIPLSWPVGLSPPDPASFSLFGDGSGALANVLILLYR